MVQYHRGRRVFFSMPRSASNVGVPGQFWFHTSVSHPIELSSEVINNVFHVRSRLASCNPGPSAPTPGRKR